MAQDADLKPKKTEFGFEQFFDKVIEDGKIIKEFTILDGFVVEMSPLNSEDQLNAEMTILSNNPDIPQDTIDRVRAVQILCRAIISLNGVTIGTDSKARMAMYEQLLRLPGVVVDKISRKYWEVVNEQAKLYGGDLSTYLQNF